MSPRKIALFTFCAGSLVASAMCGPAAADLAPSPPNRVIAPVPQPVSNRDAVALARRDPEISKQIVAARGGNSDATGPSSPTETAVQVALGGQCGFAGCSAQTLVAFTFRSAGANTTSRSVLALVTCPPVPSRPCTVSPAEIHAAGNGLPQK